MALLEIKNLTVEFPTLHGAFRAVDSVDLAVAEGDVVAIVGESGSGKSVLMLTVMGLLPWTARVNAERMTFAGQNLLGLSAADRRRIIGKDTAMIFQEPMTSLNPCFTVGFQLTESIKVHEGGTRAERRRRALDLLAVLALVADQPAGEAHQDRRQDRHARPIRHLPNGRGRGVEGIVPGILRLMAGLRAPPAPA
jgi:dipeptide transport system ATP-binding protein